MLVQKRVLRQWHHVHWLALLLNGSFTDWPLDMLASSLVGFLIDWPLYWSDSETDLVLREVYKLEILV